MKFMQIEKGRNPTLATQRKLWRMVLEDNLRKGHTIGELGAGRGWLQTHIVPEHLKGNWTEVDNDEIAHNQSPAKKKILADIIERLPFGDESLDAVVESACLDLFHPSKHPQLISEIKRVLRPGGRFISFQDGPPNPAIWAPELPTLYQPGYARGDMIRYASLVKSAHDKFSTALSGSLERGGFNILTRQPIFGDGIYRVEPRHSDFPEPIASFPPNEKNLYINAPMYGYVDGHFMPLAVKPGKEGVIPSGHKGEIFGGRVIVAEKPLGSGRGLWVPHDRQLHRGL